MSQSITGLCGVKSRRKMRFAKKLLKPDSFLFLIYRLSSVLFIQTAYVPDEYWQSLEVAHKMIFGYGYLTWEWKHGLRSYMYPSVFAFLYQTLKYFQLDTPITLTIMPRIVQATLTAVSDYYFLHFCKTMGCKHYWTKVFIFTNWFWYFCGSRTLLNTFEMSLTIIALYYYPWNIVKMKFTEANAYSSKQWVSVRTESWKYLTIAGLNCCIRPTAVTIWVPLVVYQLFQLYPARVKDFILTVATPIALLFLFLSISIDSFFYGKFVISPYNFFITNIFSGIASFYGSHPSHWYFTQGIPVVLSLHIVPFVFGIYTVLNNLQKQRPDKFDKICRILLVVVVCNIIIFSIIPHKEFRFILPLVPMMELIGIRFISTSSIFKVGKKFDSILTKILFIGFIIPTVLFGIFHQTGTLSVMSYLSKSAIINPRNSSLLFLTPCHATPLYSHLHVNVPVRFLTCDPPISADYYDESEQFFSGPLTWLENKWTELNNFSHIMLFDTVQQSIENFLQHRGFVLKQKFLHTIFPGTSSGNYILIYERG